MLYYLTSKLINPYQIHDSGQEILRTPISKRLPKFKEKPVCTWKGEHLGTAGTVSNLRPICWTICRKLSASWKKYWFIMKRKM